MNNLTAKRFSIRWKKQIIIKLIDEIDLFGDKLKASTTLQKETLEKSYNPLKKISCNILIKLDKGFSSKLDLI